MENKNQKATKNSNLAEGVTETERKVEFKGCETCGDNIQALVKYFTNTSLGSFTLERALEEVKENEIKIKEFKNKLLEEGAK